MVSAPKSHALEFNVPGFLFFAFAIAFLYFVMADTLYIYIYTRILKYCFCHFAELLSFSLL